MLHADFIQFAPDYADDYFAPKVWEVEEGMFCTIEGQFHTDLFTGDIIWNEEKGEPERVLVESELADNGEQLNDGATEEKMTAVKPLPANYRAASLVLFGPMEEITATQYGQVMDLVNDDESSFARELAEAIAREPRVLELLPERQEELLVHLRETLKETVQWTDIKRPIVKWLETPPAQREQPNKAGGDKLTIDDHKQRSMRLRYHVACGVIARSMDFDVFSPPFGIEARANSILNDKNDTEVTDWFVPLSRTPGIYEFSPAAIVAMIKTADEKLHVYPGELRQYIDKCVADFDCVNPPQTVIDIACGLTSSSLPQKHDEPKTDGKTEQTLQDENLPPAVCPARAAELDRELNAAFANGTPAERDEELRHKTSLMLAQQRGECIPELGDDPTDPKWDSMAGSASNEGEKTEVTEQEDDRLPMDAREIEIAHALNDLLSGHTSQLSADEAAGSVILSGHAVPDLLFLLMEDVSITECCLSPNLSDDEIHLVAAVILDDWSDDKFTRQKVALDAAHEYRKPTPAKKSTPAEQEPAPEECKKEDLSPVEMVRIVKSVNQPNVALTYRQQLTIAALQGLCANPAYRSHDALGLLVVELVDEVIDAEIDL